MHVVHKAVGICLVQLAVLWGVCLCLMHYMLFAQYKWGRCREWQIHKRAWDNGRLTTSAHHDCRTPFFLLSNCQPLVASRRLLSLSLSLSLHGWRNKNNVAALVNDSWKWFKVNMLADDGFYEAATVPGHNAKAPCLSRGIFFRLTYKMSSILLNICRNQRGGVKWFSSGGIVWGALLHTHCAGAPNMAFAIDLSILEHVTMFFFSPLKPCINSNLPYNRFHRVGLSLNSN